MAQFEQQGAEYEEEHVHTVYEEIASHFSSTRYKVCVIQAQIHHAHVTDSWQPWPIVERFLKELPDGAVGADVGCGNGKYLAVNPRVFIVGSDRYVHRAMDSTKCIDRVSSTNLVKIAKQHQPHSAVVADNLGLPHPTRSLDFAISIAVVHHLSTPARRIEAVKAILELLRAPLQLEQEGGLSKALIYVWALEQKESRRGWDEGHEQDVMVPWVMKGKKEKSQKKSKKKKTEEQVERDDAAEQVEDKTFLRYYHLYRKGELENDVTEAGGEVVESGYEKENWWAIAVRKT
jgi:tRNA (uracil-5-)-methyltransferase TRM9